MKKWGKKRSNRETTHYRREGEKRNAATEDKSWLFVYLMLSSNHYCVPHVPDAQLFKNRLGEGKEERKLRVKAQQLLADCTLSKRAPARTWPKPPAALMEAHMDLPMFMDMVSSLKHVNPAWKKSVLRCDSQSRQEPDTLTLIRSKYLGNHRGSGTRLLENQIYLSILQNRGQGSAATQLLRDCKT